MTNDLPVKKEYSAGGVVYKLKPQVTSYKKPTSAKATVGKQAGVDTTKESAIVWLLGKHSGYHKWVLPKGMIETGETPQVTAVRETEEELAVKARIVNPEPVHIEKYWYVAEYKKPETSNPSTSSGQGKLQVEKTVEPQRRVQTYQENANFAQIEIKVKVDKTVTFYLMEYISGDPVNHGWEMEDAGWFEYDQAMKLLAFEGEKRALSIAQKTLDSI